MRIQSSGDQYPAAGQQRGGGIVTDGVHFQGRDESVFNRVVEFRRGVARAAGYQHSAVLEQRRCLAGARLVHLRAAAEKPRLRIVNFRGIERSAARVFAAAGYQDAAVLEQRGRVVNPVVRHLAGHGEFARRRIVELGLG